MRGRTGRTIVVAMTETLHDPAPPPPHARRLVRDRDEKVVAGVCAAFGRYTDTDPVLWRVAIAVLTFFGGAGLVLYALGWLLVPEAGQRQSWAERTLRGSDGGLSAAGIVVLAICGLVLVGLLNEGPGLPALLVIGGVAYLVARERRDGPPRVASPSAAGSDGPLGAAHLQESVPYGPPPLWPDPAPAPPPRERSPLGGITVSVAAVVAGLLLGVRALGVDSVTPPRIAAGALAVVGAGLLVGTWYGRARWLIGVGVLLVGVLAATTVAQELDAGVGERTWVATGSADYELGAGEATLDLRDLRPGQEADISARLGAGHLIVLVPQDVPVRVVSSLRIGELSSDDRVLDDGPDIEREFVVGRGDPEVQLDLQVRFGEIEVRRVPS